MTGYSFDSLRFGGIQIGLALSIAVVAAVLAVKLGIKIPGSATIVAAAAGASVLEGRRKARLDSRAPSPEEFHGIKIGMFVATLIVSVILGILSIALFRLAGEVISIAALIKIFLQPRLLLVLILLFVILWFFLPFMFLQGLKNGLKRGKLR